MESIDHLMMFIAIALMLITIGVAIYFAFRYTSNQGTIQEVIQTSDRYGQAHKILIVNNRQYDIEPAQVTGLKVGDIVLVEKYWGTIHVKKLEEK